MLAWRRYQRSNTPDGITSWPAFVNNDYIKAFQAKKPIALLICAYYGVLLHQLRSKWWLRDGGTCLVNSLVAGISQTSSALSVQIDAVKLLVGL